MLERVKRIYNQYSEIINYLFFGVITTIVNLAVYYLLIYTILDPNNMFYLQCANIISWTVSVLLAYVTNRKYVFESNNPNLKKEIFKFFSSRIITLLLDMLIMYLGVFILKQNDKVFKIISQILVIVSNYLLSKLFVFNK